MLKSAKKRVRRYLTWQMKWVTETIISPATCAAKRPIRLALVPRLYSNFISTAIAGIEKITNNESYNLIISQSLELAAKEKVNAKTMYNSRVDGLLVSLSYDTTDIEHFAPFFGRQIPLIFFDRVPEDKKCTCITIDNRKAAYEVSQHLISRGCKKIAHLTTDSSSNVYRDRLRGYKEALTDHGISFNEAYVILNDLSNQGGADAARHILENNLQPDGIFAANDNCAVGCMQELMKAGISIPDDVAVAGFNNDPVSLVIQPNLTSVNYPGTYLGETAAHHLFSYFKGNSIIQFTNQIILHTELLVRASSNRQPDAKQTEKKL